MKRDVRLRALSRDHHHALVLARFIDAMCTRGGVDAAAVSLVKERFTSTIVPHFALEETLLTTLEGHGVDDLVARTRDEHATMLRLLDAADATDSAPRELAELAKLLAEHVRFEERELYPACEERLDGAVLDRIARALEHEGA